MLLQNQFYSIGPQNDQLCGSAKKVKLTSQAHRMETFTIFIDAQSPKTPVNTYSSKIGRRSLFRNVCQVIYQNVLVIVQRDRIRHSVIKRLFRCSMIYQIENIAACGLAYRQFQLEKSVYLTESILVITDHTFCPCQVLPN